MAGLDNKVGNLMGFWSWLVVGRYWIWMYPGVWKIHTGTAVRGGKIAIIYYSSKFWYQEKADKYMKVVAWD